MDCIKMLDQLSSYIDGALPERERTEIEKHLMECAECRAELAALKLLIHAAGDIEAFEPPAGLRASIAAATTARPEPTRGWTLDRLQRILSAHSLRWIGGVACAAAALVLFVGLRQVNEPANRTAVRPQSPAPISTNIAATRHTPVSVALAASPASVLRATMPHARIRHTSSSRALTGLAPSFAAPKPKPSAKKTGEERVPESAPVSQPGDDSLTVDDTTAAETVAAVDLQVPKPDVADKATKQVRSALAKIASSPVLSRDDAEEWNKHMKAEAAMRRKSHSTDVVSVINARF